MNLKYRMILTQNPGEVDSDVVVDMVTINEEIANEWSKMMAETWELGETRDSVIDDDDNICEFMEDGEIRYTLEFTVLISTVDTHDSIEVETMEDMPEFDMVIDDITCNTYNDSCGTDVDDDEYLDAGYDEEEEYDPEDQDNDEEEIV